MTWNSKEHSTNVEQLRENLVSTDKGIRAAMNVLGTHIIDCLNRLDMLGKGMDIYASF
jgi:hypothetical protein